MHGEGADVSFRNQSLLRSGLSVHDRKSSTHVLVSAYKTCVEGNSCVVFLHCDLCENFFHVAKAM